MTSVASPAPGAPDAPLEPDAPAAPPVGPASPAAPPDARSRLAAHPVAVALAIFAAGFGVRLALTFTSRFGRDEAFLWGIARDMATGEKFRLLGPPIADGKALVPGPLFCSIMALPLLVTRDPAACNVFTALLGAVAVVICWQALRQDFGERGALLAGGLMACSPWSTLYADRIWTPNGPLAVAVALSVWAATRLRRSPSLGLVVTLAVSMASMPQFHMSSPIVWFALVPIWWPSIRKWRWHWPVSGVLASLTLYIPLLVSELDTHWANTLAFLHETANKNPSDWYRVPLWDFRLLTLDVSYHQLQSYYWTHTEKEMLSFLVHGNGDFHYNLARTFVLWLSIGFALFAVASGAYRAWNRDGRERSHPYFWAAVIGIVTNSVLLGVAHKQVYGHHMGALLPFYFVVFAELGQWTETRPRAARLVFGAALLICLGGVDVALWVSQRLDARGSIATIRHVIQAIEKDAPKASRVELGFGFRGSLKGFNALSALDSKRHLRFQKGNQYRLQRRDSSAPKGGHLIMRTGVVALYRMPKPEAPAPAPEPAPTPAPTPTPAPSRGVGPSAEGSGSGIVPGRDPEADAD